MRTYLIQFVTNSKKVIIEAATIQVIDKLILLRSEMNDDDNRIIAAVPIDQLLCISEKPPLE